MSFVHASPEGEVFILSHNDTYSSFDEQNWNHENHFRFSGSSQIRYFEDNTAFYQGLGVPRIGLDGTWPRFKAEDLNSTVTSATLVNDTTYFISANAVYFSTDKGTTSTHIVDIVENLSSVAIRVYNDKILIYYNIDTQHHVQIYRGNELEAEYNLDINDNFLWEVLSINSNEVIIRRRSSIHHFDLKTLEYNLLEVDPVTSVNVLVCRSPPSSIYSVYFLS
jgi:hypothetical protein